MDEGQLKTGLKYIAIGRKEDGEPLCGGNRLTGGAYDKGYFVEPTVFADVKEGDTLATEEVFGPVLAIRKANDPADALRMANATEFGLSASIQTNRHLPRLRVRLRLRSGPAHRQPAQRRRRVLSRGFCEYFMNDSIGGAVLCLRGKPVAGNVLRHLPFCALAPSGVHMDSKWRLGEGSGHAGHLLAANNTPTLSAAGEPIPGRVLQA